MKNRVVAMQLRADPTRAKILKAARRLFVEGGFAGTSMGKIATKANVNHSLIFHHFGNKEGLWKAVKQNIVEEANRFSPTLPEINLPFRDFLEQLFINNIYFYRNNPDIVRMIAWQRLEYHDTSAVGVSLSDTSKQWLLALKHYQKAGEIDSKLKPEFILTFLLSLISSAAMDPNVFIAKKADLNSYITLAVNRVVKAFG